MLKATALSIAPPITKLFNLSIKLGCVPQTWKMSNAVQIPKVCDHTSPTNYRPMSLLSVLSNVLERHIILYDQITVHLETSHPLSNSQWGVRSEWLEAGKEVTAVFFDLRKAFDSVPHQALLDKLKNLQLSDHILKWICDYLTNRTHQVVVNGETSETLPVISDMPQSSVLGPLLFLIYML